jgi:hypothetical protein
VAVSLDAPGKLVKNVFGVRRQAQRRRFRFKMPQNIKKSKAPPLSAHSKFMVPPSMKSFSA